MKYTLGPQSPGKGPRLRPQKGSLGRVALGVIRFTAKEGQVVQEFNLRATEGEGVDSALPIVPDPPLD